MKPVDIVDVKAGINAGRLYVAVKGKYLLLGDYLTGEAVRLSDIEVKPVVHARWVLVEYTEGRKTHRCNNCKDSEYWHYKYAFGDEPFCPNCGAKMYKEVKDDE